MKTVLLKLLLPLSALFPDFRKGNRLFIYFGVYATEQWMVPFLMLKMSHLLNHEFLHCYWIISICMKLYEIQSSVGKLRQ